jgi:methylglutaconyl-CoA hydratase
VWLNRPEVHNAFDEIMIADLTDAFAQLNGVEDVRVVVLSGKGKSFSAGADLNWMKKMKDYSYQENLDDAYRLFEMIHAIYTCSKPTIAMVNGSTFGGGNGLIAACDISVASTAALFSLSEVKLGLVPAVISPYLVKKIGEGYAREFMLTGERINARDAYRIGLVNRIAEPERLQEEVDRITAQLTAAGPQALKMCKEMIHRISAADELEIGRQNAELIANLRMSEEGQEGIAAFFEKRKPGWQTD